MRFLPVFLDLQTGPVLLVGAGDLVRAKLRLLASAGARIRWFATDGNHDVSGLDAADMARIEFAEGDPGFGVLLFREVRDYEANERDGEKEAGEHQRPGDRSVLAGHRTFQHRRAA